LLCPLCAINPAHRVREVPALYNKTREEFIFYQPQMHGKNICASVAIFRNYEGSIKEICGVPEVYRQKAAARKI
jgi:hypothetical protein